MDLIANGWTWLTKVFDRSTIKNLQNEIDNVGTYDLHDVLRLEIEFDWCEWHLNINKTDNIQNVVEGFHEDFKKLKLSPSIRNDLKIIKRTFLDLKPNNHLWNEIRQYFNQAYQDDNPELVIQACIRSQFFSAQLNKHAAANTYHMLKLYCTMLNCPILAQTQEYTEAMTRIFFHPKLHERLVRNKTVYRGVCIKDNKLISDYKEGATIITTTFLSTTANVEVAKIYSASAPDDMISILCIYNIKNTIRHTALDVSNLSPCPFEEEIIILRYVPFTIRSIQQTDNGREMTIYFDEYQD